MFEKELKDLSLLEKLVIEIAGVFCMNFGVDKVQNAFESLGNDTEFWDARRHIATLTDNEVISLSAPADNKKH